MLVLTRKLQEDICIGENVKITVLRISGSSVRIGIEAPRDLRIVRGELELHVDESQLDENAVSHDEASGTATRDKPSTHSPSIGTDKRCSRISRWPTGDAKTTSTLSLLAARCRDDSCRRRAS